MLSTNNMLKQTVKPAAAKAPIVCPRAVAFPRARPAVAKALLLPNQQQQTADNNPVQAVLDMILSWLEPQGQSTDPEYPELDMDYDDGHAGWGHSHIADRLATEPSSRASMASVQSQEY